MKYTYRPIGDSLQCHQPGDFVKWSIPFSYVTVEARSIDGFAHDVKIYSDITSGMSINVVEEYGCSSVPEWLTGDDTATLLMSRQNSRALALFMWLISRSKCRMLTLEVKQIGEQFIMQLLTLV
jgi:hypothetical protein